MTHFRRILQKIHILLLLLSGIICALPLEAKKLPQSFRTITTDDGLSDNLVFSLCKDSTGFIWFGTQLGLNRFDGINIKKYESLDNVLITAICEADSVNLLIGTESGLKKINRKTLAVEDIRLDDARIIVRAILKVDNHKFLVGTEQGLYYIDDKNVRKIVFENGITSSNHITSIIDGGNSTFWLTSQNGLCFMDLKNDVMKVYRSSALNHDINNMSCLTRIDSTIWIGTANKGILSFNGDTKVFSHNFPFLGNNYILNITNDGENLYIGTNGGGLKIYSTKTKEISSIYHSSDNPNSIRSNAIYSFLLDGDIFWVGTYKHGVSYNLNVRENFHTFSSPYFNSNNFYVRSFLIDKNENKLIGTRSGLYFISSEGKLIKKFTLYDNSILMSDIILTIYPFGEEMLIGTFGGGMYIFNPRSLTLKRFKNEADFVDRCIFYFATDKDDCLWIATDVGVYMLDPRSDILKNYNTVNTRLSNNNVIYLMNDSKNRIWLGTNDGLSVLDKSTGIIRSDIFPKEYEHVLKIVNYIYEDSAGNLWICTKKGILQVSESLTDIKYHSEGLFNNIFLSVAGVGDDLWFASSVGIVKYTARDNNFSLYNIADGIRGYDFNNFVQQTKDGKLWWANEKGLVFCTPDDFVSQNRKSNPVITSLFVNQKEYHGDEEQPISAEYLDNITLSSSENNIGFHFSLLSFSLPKSGIYEYMLEGYDKTWQRSIGRDEVYYAKLPSGSYSFLMRDYNNPTLQKKIHITIKPSYTTVMWIGIFIVIFVIVFFIFLYTIRKLKGQIKKIWSFSVSGTESEKNKYSAKNLTQSKIDLIRQSLLNVMEEEKPFLNSNLKVANLAQLTDCSVAELSHVLNVDMGTNFADFINFYRVNEFKSILNKDILSRLTLKTLSEKCGFKSRTTFYRAFNKDTGMSPLEYCKKMGFHP